MSGSTGVTAEQQRVSAPDPTDEDRAE